MSIVVADRCTIGLVGDWTTEWKWAAWARALDNLAVPWLPFKFGAFFRGYIGIWQRRTQTGLGVWKLNRYLRDWVIGNRPQVIYIWNGLPVHANTVKSLSEFGWVTCYTNDSPFGDYAKWRLWRHFRRAIKEYNSHHVYRDSDLQEYSSRFGVRNVRKLRSYAVPWLHYPEPTDAFRYDVIFVGHCEPNRLGSIQALLDAEIPVRVMGPTSSWRRFADRRFMHEVGPIHALDVASYRQVLSSAGICLAFLSRGNRDLYTRRCFEIPACGGFLLCERTAELQDLYEEGTEAEFFECNHELVDKVRFYLSNPSLRQRIAERGRRRYHASGYDVITAVRRWLRDIEDFSGLPVAVD